MSKIHRFFSDHAFAPGSSFVVAEPVLVHQWRHVLRIHTGERLILFNARGEEAVTVFEGWATTGARVRCEKVVRRHAPRGYSIILACAIIRRENFEWAAQKATEIGVSEIVPLRTERTIKQNISLERVERIVREAAEQSGQIRVPVVRPMCDLADVLARSSPSEDLLVCDEGAKTHILDLKEGKTRKILEVLVGPEGGWSPEEKKLFVGRRIPVVHLGPHTLRAETAAALAVYCANIIQRTPSRHPGRKV